MIAVYPGSFDPVTLGHLDIIDRSAKIADKLYIGLLTNVSKSNWFTPEERAAHLSTVTAHIPNIEVRIFDGLLAEFVKTIRADVIIRGFRFDIPEYEMQMALANKIFGAETLFMPANPAHLHLSSTIVKEVAVNGGDITNMVPDALIDEIAERCGNRQEAFKWNP